MLECLILGDSLAVGIGMNRPDCATIARVGITSEKWLSSYQNHPTFQQPYRVVVISLGTNDFRNTTAETLYNTRIKIKANLVVWVLPNQTLKPIQRQIVKELANEFRDKTIELTHLSHDGIHPTPLGYKEAANKISDIQK
jgi:lysophospholipase L1-like esterase